MYRRLPVPVIMLTLLLLAGPVSAQEFSADVISHMLGGQVSKGKMYSTANKMRFDSSIKMPGGKVMESRMIMDRSAKLIYIVEPQQRTILVNHVLERMHSSGSSGSVCADLAQALGPSLPQGMQSCKQVGSETVMGRSASKWQVEMRTLTGQMGVGSVWVDSQLKTAVKWDFPGLGSGSGELQNIQVGSQPASLFVLPADYRRQDLP